MKQQESNFWTELPYNLIVANILIVVLIIVSMFGGIDLLARAAIALIVPGLIVGIASAITGIGVVVGYIRGKRYHSKFLGPFVILIGSGMIVMFLWVIFIFTAVIL
jgi:hypothetical protein